MSLHIEWKKSLNERIPCRKNEINFLLSLFGQGTTSLCPALFIYGHTATGKTLIVKSIMETCRFPFAFVNCVEAFSARILYESILQQLSRFEDEAIDWDESDDDRVDLRCSCMNEFVRNFVRLINKSSLSNRTVFIVLDKAERLRDLSNYILPSFIKLNELSGANVCVVLISELVWEKFRGSIVSSDPLPFHFPNYTREEMIEILASDRPTDYPRDFYKNYISLVLSVFLPVCRDLNELRHVCCQNFKTYCHPIEQGDVNDTNKLWRKFAPLLRKSLRKVYSREATSNYFEEIQQTSISSAPLITTTAPELPFYTKFLIIAAYLASYNPAKSDKRFFLKNAGRMRRTLKGTKKNERLTNHMLGPKIFPLDRLLAIFYSIVDEPVKPSFLIFTQISSLVSLNFIAQIESADLLQTPKYKCLASLECVRSISRTVNFDVVRYLYDFI